MGRILGRVYRFCCSLRSWYRDRLVALGNKMKTFRIAGICKAKNLIKAITFSWFGIGREYQIDETDTELFGRN